MDVSTEHTGDAASDVDVSASVAWIVLGKASSDMSGVRLPPLLLLLLVAAVCDWRKSVMSSISLF